MTDPVLRDATDLDLLAIMKLIGPPPKPGQDNYQEWVVQADTLELNMGIQWQTMTRYRDLL